MQGELDERVRVRLIRLLEASAPAITGGTCARNAPATPEGRGLMAEVVLDRLEFEWGEEIRLRHGHGPNFRVLLAELRSAERDVGVLDILGAWLDVYARLPGCPWFVEKESSFARDLDAILQDTRYARRDRELIRRADLGTSHVIELPVHRFLATRPGWQDLDEKLRQAQSELAAGNSGDAVTDTGTALQMLFDHLGYPGTALGDQLKGARKVGAFDGIDTPLGDGLEDLCRWVASVRNQRGDAHPGPEPDLVDAEFVFRIVCALVLRLG